MRGRDRAAKEVFASAESSRDPSSVSFADTFSHKGRRTFAALPVDAATCYPPWL